MILSSKENIRAKGRVYKFELPEDEFAELLAGKKIILETSTCTPGDKRAKFILKFKGTKR